MSVGQHRGATQADGLFGLLVPAGSNVAVRLVLDPNSSVGISDIIGGVLLDEAIHWIMPDGERLAVHLGENRAGRPANQALSAIATRLGINDRSFHAAARGDALILGTDLGGSDTHLPTWVVPEATRSGLSVVAEHAPSAVRAPHRPTSPTEPGTTGWTLNTRIWQLRLNPQLVGTDLAELGLHPTRTHLHRILAGVEPATPQQLAALIQVLQLHDKSLTHEQVLAATTKPWTTTGQRIPPPITHLLATTRNLTVQQVHNITNPGRALA